MRNFPGYFSRTFQDQSGFPGLSRYRNFQEKIQDFAGGVGTLYIPASQTPGSYQLTDENTDHVLTKSINSGENRESFRQGGSPWTTCVS